MNTSKKPACWLLLALIALLLTPATAYSQRAGLFSSDSGYFLGSHFPIMIVGGQNAMGQEISVGFTIGDHWLVGAAKGAAANEMAASVTLPFPPLNHSYVYESLMVQWLWLRGGLLEAGLLVRGGGGVVSNATTQALFTFNDTGITMGMRITANLTAEVLFGQRSAASTQAATVGLTANDLGGGISVFGLRMALF